VYNMPKNVRIITYEFAWLGGFNHLQKTLEAVDEVLTDQLNRMVENGVLSSYPKLRVSFLTSQGGEEE
jgi:DNA-binding HxlR family transcriptional regulator